MDSVEVKPAQSINTIQDLEYAIEAFKSTQKLLRRGFFGGRDSMSVAMLKGFYENIVRSTKFALQEAQRAATIQADKQAKQGEMIVTPVGVKNDDQASKTA